MQGQQLPLVDSFSDLFGGHNYNAHKLFQDSSLRNNFSQLLQDYDRVELHENFAGTGNAGRSLRNQFEALKKELQVVSQNSEKPSNSNQDQ